MSCPDPIELSRALVAGIDGKLQAHLDGCARCTAELASHRSIADDTRVLPVVEPTMDRARAVRMALMTAATQAPIAVAPRRLWLLGAGAALAAAAVLVVMLRGPESTVAYRGTIHAHAGATFIRVGGVPDEIVRLTSGTITVEVAPLATGERFRVITADGEVEVRGTAFDVRAEADKLAAVHVLHGKVEVRASGATPRLLVAGERWDMQVAHVAPDEPIVAPDQAAVARVEVPRTEVTRSRKQGAPSHSPRVPSAPAQPSITTDATKAPALATKRPIELLFEQGWAALAAGNAREAATVFERAASSAPNDPLAEDAWFWRASALARAKHRAAAGALEDFLARYPRSNRVGEASAVLGWLVVATDLDRAEQLFSAAAKDRVPAVRESAGKGLAAVARQRAP